MNKLKKEKGITLVALIITIVVLLILAIVSIGAVKDSGIIGHAQNAATDYNAKQKEEEGLLAQYETIIDEQMGIGPWKVQEDGTIKNGKTEETKKIGDTFTNDEVLAATGGTKSSYTGTWTILGVENGRLKLVSTTNVTTTEVELGKEDPEVYVKDENGNPTTTLKPEIVEIYDKAGEETSLDVEKAIWSYQHAVETLNGHAKTATGITSARSITIEDLEAKDVLNITDAKKVELKSVYGRTHRYFWGKYNMDLIFTQYLERNYIDDPAVEDTAEEGWVAIDEASYNVFINYDKTIINSTETNKNNVVKLKSNYYKYSNAFTDTQFVNSLGTGYYWLASPYVDCQIFNAKFGVHYVFDGSIGGDTCLFDSNGDAHGNDNGVRAVVYI